MMEIFSVLIMMVVAKTVMYMFVKIYQTVNLKQQILLCILYLRKSYLKAKLSHHYFR